jgi:hypothetical protein
LTEALDLGPGLMGQRAVELWPKVVGEAIAVHARAEGVREDTLLVVTDSPVWSHQLQLLAAELLAKLRDAVGPECPVRQIRFRSGTPWRSPWSRSPDEAAAGLDAAAATVERAGRPQLRPPLPGDRRMIEEAAAAAGDEAIVAALRGVFAAQAGVRWPPPTS